MDEGLYFARELIEEAVAAKVVIEADSKEEVEAFNRNDPFNKVGLWQRISIHPFSKRVDNRG